MYHVTLRGNHREMLFAGPEDRRALDDIVAQVIQTRGARVHGFCWMTNHLHAIVQVTTEALGTIMQPIAMRYARYRHKLLRVTGHLFEKRHGAELIDDGDYFLTVLRYIHLNPVTAGIVDDACNYPWTSHRAYQGSEHIPWLTTVFGLSLFSSDAAKAREAYQRFMSCNEDELTATPDSGVIDRRRPEQPSEPCPLLFPPIHKSPARSARPRSSLTLPQLAAQLCTTHSITPALLCAASRERSLSLIRAELAALAIEEGIATCSEVARFLGRDPSVISRLLARHPRSQ